MKVLAMALLAGYTFLTVWGFMEGGIGWDAVSRYGPMGVAAFAIGYMVDLLIFGLLARGSVRAWRKARKGAARDAATE